MIEHALLAAASVIAVTAGGVALTARLRSRPGFVVAASLFVLALLLVRDAPRVALFRVLHVPVARDAPEVSRAIDALAQFEDPFAPIQSPTNRVLRWRLLPPLLARALALPPEGYLALPFLGCAIALGFVLVTVRTVSDARTALAATLLAATGSWFLVSTGWLSYFDSWYVLALLVASFTPSRRTLALVCLLAPWVDERFVLGVPLVLAVRAARGESLRRDAPSALAVTLAYVVVRVGALTLDGSSREHLTTNVALSRFASVPLERWARGIWHGLRVGWFLVAALPWIIARRASALVLGAVAASVVASLLVANDVSRSASIASPALVLAAVELARRAPALARRVLLGAALLNLALPARHVVTTYEMRVTALPAQLERWHEVDRFLDPAFYVGNADRLAASGHRDLALAELDSALAVDPAFAPALLLRGRIRRELDEPGPR